MRYIDAIHLRLEELCEKKGVTLRALCQMSGVSPSLAKRLENKEIRDMSFSPSRGFAGTFILRRAISLREKFLCP